VSYLLNLPLLKFPFIIENQKLVSCINAFAMQEKGVDVVCNVLQSKNVAVEQFSGIFIPSSFIANDLSALKRPGDRVMRMHYPMQRHR